MANKLALSSVAARAVVLALSVVAAVVGAKCGHPQSWLRSLGRSALGAHASSIRALLQLGSRQRALESGG